MLLAKTEPATVKRPPTTSNGCIGPAPSGSHIVIARTLPFVPWLGSHCVAHCAQGRPVATPRTTRKRRGRQLDRGVDKHVGHLGVEPALMAAAHGSVV